MKSVRKRLTFANVVSSLALFLVVAGGTAFAASHLGKETVGTKQLKKEAVSLAKINAAAKKALQGATGPIGPAGAKGDKGDKGDKGERGEAGPFPSGPLPSGKTLRGTYSVSTHQNTAGEYHNTAVSFGFELASAPTGHFIPESTTPPAGCPGSAADPEAEPGNLCVYEGVSQNQGGTPTLFNPVNGGGGVSPFGFGLSVTGGASTSSNILSYGTWAVTTP